MKTKISNIFKGYDFQISFNGYSETLFVTIEGALKSKTITELCNQGFTFEIEPKDGGRLRIRIQK